MFPLLQGRISTMKRILWGLVAAGLFLGVTGEGKADYEFTTIDVPGSIATEAYGINASGQIVGLYYDGAFHGFLRDVDGTYTRIDVTGRERNLAYGINDSGQIVGEYVGGGFLRDVDGTYITIDSVVLRGINNAGDIVGAGAGGSFLLSGGIYT